MTSKQNKLSTPTKPAPVELRDQALDAAAGGLAAVQKVRGGSTVRAGTG